MNKKRKAAMRAIKKNGGGSLPPTHHGPIDKTSICPQCQASNCKGCVQNGGVTRCGCTDPMHRHIHHVTDDVPVPGYMPPQASEEKPQQVRKPRPLSAGTHWLGKGGFGHGAPRS